MIFKKICPKTFGLHVYTRDISRTLAKNINVQETIEVITVKIIIYQRQKRITGECKMTKTAIKKGRKGPVVTYYMTKIYILKFKKKIC